MKKEELKVNDRVKFKHHSGEIYTGTISSIWLNIFNINVDKSFGGGFVTVGGTKIVSKLEKETFWREILIEKEIDVIKPKSFSFDIYITKYNQNHVGGKITTTISGYPSHTYEPFENLLVLEWLDFNKQYTIEIKEKS